MDPALGMKVGEVAGQLFSFTVLGLVAKWYLAPYLSTLPRARALMLVTWPRALSYFVLQLFQAQKTGLQISDFGRDETIRFNALGSVLAIVLLLLLRRNTRFAIAFAWVVAIEFIASLAFSMVTGVREHLLGTTTGLSWIQIVYFQPILVVCCVLQLWQLWLRRGELPAARPERARPELVTTVAHEVRDP